MLICNHELLADVDGLLPHILHRDSWIATHQVGLEVLEDKRRDISYEEIDGCLAEIIIHNALKDVSHGLLERSLCYLPAVESRDGQPHVCQRPFVVPLSCSGEVSL